MTSILNIWNTARIEARILLRSWAFRIFSILALVGLVFMDIGLATKVGNSPYFFHALSASLPLMNIKLFNVYQGVIAIFLASDWIKRDRRLNSTEVIYARSIKNLEYVIGKVFGLLMAFAVLNVAVLVATAIIHAFFSVTQFTFLPYLYLTFVITLPTLIFIFGVTFFAMSFLRSQAVIFVLGLGASLVSLVLLGKHLFNVFDPFAFHQPVIFSDFVGLGNVSDLLQLRGCYFLLGLGLIFISVLLLPRLSQSRVANTAAALFGVVALLASAALGFSYLDGKYDARDYRNTLMELNRSVRDYPLMSVSDYRITVDHNGHTISAAAEMTVVNGSERALDSILLSINPALYVTAISDSTGDMRFVRDQHLLWVMPKSPLEPSQQYSISVSYAGGIDERYCYLDIPQEKIEGPFRVGMFVVPKRYAFVGEQFIHLTPEVGWYPIAGLPQGASSASAAAGGFSHFECNVTVSPELTVVSQGNSSVDTVGDKARYSFSNDVPLPGISLTVGHYRKRTIDIDSVTYALFTLTDHNYIDPYFDEIIDTLPSVIRSLRNDYEQLLGLEYPYERLSLVEVPVQYYCYPRLSTMAQEAVQPEIVALPENGIICDGADFARMERRANRQQERANQLDPIPQIQAGYLSTFVRIELFGSMPVRFGLRMRGEFPRYYLLPNYLGFVTQIESDRKSVLNQALESYLFAKAAAPQDTRSRRWRGLTEVEKANLALRDRSLADLIEKSDSKIQLNTLLQVKGQQLFRMLAAEIGKSDFDERLSDFLSANRFAVVSAESFAGHVGADVEFDLGTAIDSWYNESRLPGYVVDGVDHFKVLDGEYTRHQIKLTITNPQPVDGLVSLGVSVRTRERRGLRGFSRAQERFDIERYVLLPAMTTKEIGILLDDAPARLTVDTYVSLNLPSVLTFPLGEGKLRQREVAFDGERLLEYARVDSASEYIVDNEDDGFLILTQVEENLLRRLLLSLFSSEEDDDQPYVGFRIWDPPGGWKATTDVNFFGRFVRSAYFKKAGDGTQEVAWNVELRQSGDYDLYYYVGEPEAPRWFRGRGDRQENKGERTLLVEHEDGVENVVIDLNLADDGWNYLGSYRLAAGDNRVLLTDKGDNRIVIADAVKWVRR